MAQIGFIPCFLKCDQMCSSHFRFCIASLDVPQWYSNQEGLYSTSHRLLCVWLRSDLFPAFSNVIKCVHHIFVSVLPLLMYLSGTPTKKDFTVHRTDCSVYGSDRIYSLLSQM